MKVIILFTTLISVTLATSQIYYTDIPCTNSSVCPTNSFCDIPAGTCACNFGWAHDSPTTCRYKLRCQQTAIQNSLLPTFAYFYMGLESLGIGFIVLFVLSICFNMTGIAFIKFFDEDSCMTQIGACIRMPAVLIGLAIMIWTIVLQALIAQNEVFDENGFPLLISGCS